MTEISDFGLIVLIVAAGVSLALLGRAMTERLAVPSAALFLVAAAVVSDVFPGIRDAVSFVTVERIGVVALIVILFDGGLDIGWRHFRSAAVPILSLGVLGTFATAGLIALAAHELLGLSWTTSGLLGAALAPTDPAVTFSVLGGREIIGRTGTILKGESGANDPVGIALMIGLIELATTDDGTFWTVVKEFSIEMAGGVVDGAATLVHGSGFLAVFVAGILLGDRLLPHRREVDGFLSSLGSLAEIAMFVALGLTIDLTELFENDAWLEGLVLAALLAF